MNNKRKEEGFENFNMNDFLGKRSERTLADEVSKQSEERQQIFAGKPDELDKPDNADSSDSLYAVSKSNCRTVPDKQRKLDLQEYKEQFLSVPKITDRKTVFISNDIREQIVNIVRKLGAEKSSVSGFIENLVTHHLETYREDVEKWIKL